jgi:hypothetical protein
MPEFILWWEALLEIASVTALFSTSCKELVSKFWCRVQSPDSRDFDPSPTASINDVVQKNIHVHSEKVALAKECLLV